MSPGAPTELVVWDAILRAAAALSVLSLASRARPRSVFASTVVIAIASLGADAALVFAAPALGCAVALAATVQRRAPVAAALIASLLVHASFRLEIGGFHGVETIVALAGLVPALASGWRHLRSHQRQRARPIILVVAALVAAAALGGLVGALLAGGPALEGIDEARRGLDVARTGDTSTASAHFQNASRSFSTARDRIEAPWAVLGRLIPIEGQHLAALQKASRAGSEVALTGARSAGLARLDDLRVVDGRVDTTRVAALEEPFEDTDRALDRARRELATARSPWLIAPAQRALEREASRVDRASADADLALHIVRVLPGLLGDAAPRRYFVAIQQPAEARGSGGIIGNYGELAATDGHLDIVRFGTDGDLNAAAEASQATLDGAPDDYVRRYGRFGPETVWQNVSASPDFRSVSQVIKVLYPQSGGAPIDGVISVDPTALAALMTVTGPMQVDPWPEPLSADNVEQILHVEQYVRFPAGSEEERKQFLSDVAERVTEQLTTKSLPRPDELVRRLGPAVRGRHFQFASFDPEEQALFERIGAAGRLETDAPDYLAVINQNAGGNKLDTFLRRSYRYEADDIGATLTLDLRNDAPTGLGILAAGNYQGDPEGTNRTFVSVYSPRPLLSATLDGEPLPLESERERDANVYSAFVVIPRSSTRTLVVRLGDRPSRNDDDRYAVALHRQPLINDDEVDVRAGGLRFAGSLAVDRLVIARR